MRGDAFDQWIKQSEANRVAYTKWLESPVTKMVVSKLRAESTPKPYPANTVSSNMSTHMLGYHIGANYVLDRISDLEKQEREFVEESSEYGYEGYIRKFGFSKKAIEKAEREAENG